MSAYRRVRFATAATALVFGSALGAPGAAVGAAARTVPAASQDSSNCTSSNVAAAADQNKEPWEISVANPGNLTDQHGTSLTGDGVTVAVIDTGIQQQAQLSVAGGAVLSGESGDAKDDDGHGTMVASIIAAKKGGGNAMQGIAPGVRLLSMREAGCQATGGNTEDSMAAAIDDAVDQGADVINISQDGYVADAKLYAAVQNAYQHGDVVVTSAGNQGDRDTTDSGGSNTDYGVNPTTYPASYKQYVLAVGAVDQYGMVPTFSETGTAKSGYYIGVVAPGVAVEGLLPDGKLAVDDGTSFAAPYVAAEAALVIEEHGWDRSSAANTSRAYDVMKIIEATADGDGGYNPAQGWGEADIAAALRAPVSDTLVAPGQQIAGLTRMLGEGPNADGQTTTANAAADQTVVKPYVAASVDVDAQHQQRWAFIALIGGLLVALVALAGSAVARDAARRRGGEPRP